MSDHPPSLRRPRENYAHFYDFVNLDNEWESFDLTESIGTETYTDEGVYYGRESDWKDTILYRTDGHRWVIVFVILPGHEGEEGPVSRELTSSQAARYLRFNHIRPPVGLRPAPSFYDDTLERREGQARLVRDWLPPGMINPRSTDGSTSFVGQDPFPNPNERSHPIANRLPIPGPATTTPPEVENHELRASVILNGLHEPPIVLGKQKNKLTKAQYDVIQTLLPAGARLNKDELSRRSKHDDARKILDRLAKSDPDWMAVIIFPGNQRTGYGIRQ